MTVIRTGIALVTLGVLLGTRSPSADDVNDLRPAAERLSPVPVAAVTIRDAFWAPRLEVNRTRTLDHVLQEIESTGGLRNFDIAAGKTTSKFGGPFWADSDVYKWIEGASWTLATHPDPALDAKVDSLIARIAAAQQPDGYLDTFVQINVPDLRFKNFAFFHEDFSAGHLFEAAVAHYLSTGKKTLLTVATRLADLFDRQFGPGRQDYISGHEGIELALVKLSRVTGERRYLDLAKAMVDRRGQKPSIFERQFKQLDPNRTVDFLGRPLRIGEWYERFYLKDPRTFDTRYAQDHVPVREQKEAVGHAVRAMFLYCAMADLVYETSDAGLWAASKALHDSVTLHRMYVTGGIGPSESNEGFTADYDLPNEDAYQETCASAAMVLRGHRVVERLLHDVGASPVRLKSRWFQSALRRGPLMYALEAADNPVSLRDIVLPAGATFQSRFDPGLAGGAVRITTEGLVHDAANWDRQLYQPVQPSTPKRVPLTAVPYAIWGNRGLGEMLVWIDASM